MEEINWNTWIQRFIKMLDIAYLTAIYFVLGLVAASIFDNLYGPYDSEAEQAKSTPRLWFELIIHLGILGIVAYLLRNLVKSISFPLNGMAGFDHSTVKELSGGIVLTFALLNQSVLRRKIQILYNRLLWSSNHDPDYLFSNV